MCVTVCFYHVLYEPQHVMCLQVAAGPCLLSTWVKHKSAGACQLLEQLTIFIR